MQPNYLIIVDRNEETHLDEAELQVEMSVDAFSDETRNLETLRTKIATTLKSKLGINMKIKLVEPKTIERSIGKAKRVIDRRKI